MNAGGMIASEPFLYKLYCSVALQPHYGRVDQRSKINCKDHLVFLFEWLVAVKSRR